MNHGFAVSGILVVMLVAGVASAEPQGLKHGVGAFGKGGPAAVRVAAVSLESKDKAPTTQKADRYVCPMKCDESDKPGKCPKCGMDLKKQAAPSPEHNHR